MTPPSLPITTDLEWIVQTVRLGGFQVPIGRLCLTVHLPLSLTPAVYISERAWLDTAAPLSVVPYHVQRKGIAWRPLPGVRTTWSGQPSSVGHIDIWLPTLPAGTLRGPLPMLAKFPDSDPPGDPVPVLLGLEFLLTHQASLTLPPPPQLGAITVP